MLTVIFYLLFVRPTVVSQRFVAAIENHDFNALNSIVANTSSSDRFLFLTDEYLSSGHVEVHVHLEPRSWDDIIHFQRRLQFELSHHGDDSNWGSAVQITIGAKNIRTPIIDLPNPGSF
jgi:hypothetical protein